jgi:hypothetical protein
MGLGSDPGSEIRDPEKNLFRIPDLGPGVEKALDPGSGSATLLKRYQNFSDQEVCLRKLFILFNIFKKCIEKYRYTENDQLNYQVPQFI